MGRVRGLGRSSWLKLRRGVVQEMERESVHETRTGIEEGIHGHILNFPRPFPECLLAARSCWLSVIEETGGESEDGSGRVAIMASSVVFLLPIEPSDVCIAVAANSGLAQAALLQTLCSEELSVDCGGCEEEITLQVPFPEVGLTTACKIANLEEQYRTYAVQSLPDRILLLAAGVLDYLGHGSALKDVLREIRQRLACPVFSCLALGEQTTAPCVDERAPRRKASPSWPPSAPVPDNVFAKPWPDGVVFQEPLAFDGALLRWRPTACSSRGDCSLAAAAPLPSGAAAAIAACFAGWRHCRSWTFLSPDHERSVVQQRDARLSGSAASSAMDEKAARNRALKRWLLYAQHRLPAVPRSRILAVGKWRWTRVLLRLRSPAVYVDDFVERECYPDLLRELTGCGFFDEAKYFEEPFEPAQDESCGCGLLWTSDCYRDGTVATKLSMALAATGAGAARVSSSCLLASELWYDPRLEAPERCSRRSRYRRFPVTLLRLLVRLGADPTLEARHVELRSTVSPLVFAVLNDNVECARCLIRDYGASASRLSYAVVDEDCLNEAPLLLVYLLRYRAAASPQLVELLLEAGATPPSLSVVRELVVERFVRPHVLHRAYAWFTWGQSSWPSGPDSAAAPTTKGIVETVRRWHVEALSAVTVFRGLNGSQAVHCFAVPPQHVPYLKLMLCVGDADAHLCCALGCNKVLRYELARRRYVKWDGGAALTLSVVAVGNADAWLRPSSFEPNVHAGGMLHGHLLVYGCYRFSVASRKAASSLLSINAFAPNVLTLLRRWCDRRLGRSCCAGDADEQFEEFDFLPKASLHALMARVCSFDSDLRLDSV